MNKTNIKINYMLLEQILRATGTYKNICDEHRYLDIVFKQAKTGDIDLFKDDNTRNIILGVIKGITGVSTKYWVGEKRIKLGIRCKNEALNYDGESIDTVNLDNDKSFFNKEEGKGRKGIKGHAYHGKLYQEQLRYPLHMEPEDIYEAVNGKEAPDDEDESKKVITPIQELYSLEGLLKVILINMEHEGEIKLIDKTNVNKNKKATLEPFIRKSKTPTKQGISYSPKFIEIRRGLVQTIIKNIFDIGYIVTLRDLDKKKFSLFPKHKIKHL